MNIVALFGDLITFILLLIMCSITILFWIYWFVEILPHKDVPVYVKWVTGFLILCATSLAFVGCP